MRKQLVRSARYVVVAAMVTIATAPSTADATLGAPSVSYTHLTLPTSDLV